MGKVIYLDTMKSETVVSGCCDKDRSAFSGTVRTVPKYRRTNNENAAWERLIKNLDALDAAALRQRYSKEYNSWRNMKSRCKKKKLTVHPAIEKFEDFLQVFGPVPSPSHTLDRINYNNPEYSPENCRWASKQLQSANRSMTRMLTDSKGRTLSLSEWSRQSNISADTIRNRVDRGEWTVDEAVTIPVGGRRRRVSDTSLRVSGTELGQLWELCLREYHKQEFCHLDAKHLRMLKEIVESLGRADQDPNAALRFLIQSWSTFCIYAEKHWGAYKSPRFPTVQFLRGNLTAAGNFLLEYGRYAPETNVLMKPAIKNVASKANKARIFPKEEEERPATKEEALAIIAAHDERMKKL